ncbi:MAG: patatin-like phospholipase family protein [Nitrospirota bacterium]|nr:MAG: patatin-like phospholipase family protein [Nitrospirota bacterium]
MNNPDGKKQFLQDVFPAELEEISKRRQNLDISEVPSDQSPSAKLGLVGLALSGGGIRSSTFSLGVIQALAKHGLLKSVDYLSTVSGGGFIGSCLSSLLKDPNVGPEQDRFPLRYQVGTREPLAVGQLREGAQYLAPGGILDKLRIPALLLRGILSNLLIFVFLILLMVLVTEFVYEIGSNIHLPFDYLVLGGVGVFVLLVIVLPLISRVLRGRSNWAQRNIQELTFAVILVLLLSLLFLVPMFLFIDQSLDQSWVEVKRSVTTDLLRPFEPRDYLQWLVILLVLVLFMFAGRASKHLSRWGGKLLLFLLGLLGPGFLLLLYLVFLTIQIDSPFITPNELLSLDVSYAHQLGDMDRVTPELRNQFKEHGVRLSQSAQVITLREDLRWLIHDGSGAYALVREPHHVSVYPDYQYQLNRGRIKHELREAMAKKGYRLSPNAQALPDGEDNRFKILGSHLYWVNHEPTTGEWGFEQIVPGPDLSEILQTVSYTLQISDAPTGLMIHAGISLSDDDLGQAVRFVEEANPHDVVVLLDNSVPPFADRKAFEETFKASLERTVMNLRSTVKMAVFWYDEHVYKALSLELLTRENKEALLNNLFKGRENESPRLDFRGKRSNLPAALERAVRELSENGRPGVRQSIILLSDGRIELEPNRHDQSLQNWIEDEFTDYARHHNIRFYGITFSKRAHFNLFRTLAGATGGTFYPIFESKTGVTFEDLVGAMQNVEKAAGSDLVSPFDKVRITDRRNGRKYELSRAKEGVRIRSTRRDSTLTTQGLLDLTDQWRQAFSDLGIALSDKALVRQQSDHRWEIQDPYHYIISRKGERLKIVGTSEQRKGFFGGILQGSIAHDLWDDRADWITFGVLGILFLYWLTVDINQTAAHSFYRDRLSKAYLFQLSQSGGIEHHDSQKLSELNAEGSAAPYHLINVALNLQGSRDPSLRGRVSDFFIFSKCFTGCERTGYLGTEQMESYDGNLDLGTAMAISGAAASPNAGVATQKSLVFIMTLLNIRLGYWIPNPMVANDASFLTRIGLRRGPGPKYLLKESLGHLDMAGRFINVSDGGHIENLGVYELLRRRCKFIIAVDGGRDPEMKFGSLVKLMLYARIDLGIEIEIDLDPIRKNAEGLSTAHSSLGIIRYADGETGYLLYIKSSLTGDEYEYIRKYQSENPDFPHESTAGQFFSEARFEAYRSLGFHIGDELFSNAEALGEFKKLQPAARPVAEHA